jgi:hypothetical protein
MTEACEACEVFGSIIMMTVPDLTWPIEELMTTQYLMT